MLSEINLSGDSFNRRCVHAQTDVGIATGTKSIRLLHQRSSQTASDPVNQPTPFRPLLDLDNLPQREPLQTP